MKNMKRIIALILALVFCVAVISACGNSGGSSSGGGDETTAAAADETTAAADDTEAADTTEAAADDTEAAGSSGGAGSGGQIAYIIPANQTLGINDKAFIQDGWENIVEWCEENGKTCNYYQAIDDSQQSHMDTYELAISNGAEVIITMGVEASDALNVTPWDHPDVKFISIESIGYYGDNPTYDEIAPNHYSAVMNATQGGWLAGVAAVREGYKELGIIPCLDIPTVNMWSWGYIQGANYAANKYGIDGVKVRHYYANAPTATPETQALAASWYADGVECIQCNTAGGNNSIIAAAEAAGKVCFGSDCDEWEEGECVAVSEIVERGVVIKTQLDKVYDGTFEGGIAVVPGVEQGAAGLSMEHSRLKNYTMEMYEEDLQLLVDDIDGTNSNIITWFDYDDIDDVWEAMDNKVIEFINLSE